MNYDGLMSDIPFSF